MKVINYRLLWIFFFGSFYLSGQNSEIFHEINELGLSYVKNLRNGNIESMKDSKPPKDTWTYNKLLAYKEQIAESSTIKYGSFISPTLEPDTYGFNFFALDYKKDERPYFFVAVVSIKINENIPSIDNAYLFTEKVSLGRWWMSTVSFYKEMEDENYIKRVPDKYLYPICPPPPYNYETE